MFKNRVNEGEKKVLAIVISCPSDGLTLNLNISKIPFQVEILKCNYKYNNVNAREAGIMLDYIIKNYNNNSYKKYLFLHDHEVSTHYQISIIKRLNEIVKQNYIYTSKLIGVNCHYYTFDYWSRYSSYRTILAVDKFLSKSKIDHINITMIAENKYIFPCCASFFVDKELIHLHNLQYYKNIRYYLKKFIINGSKIIEGKYYTVKNRNYLAGAYMEFTWTTMFGQKYVSLPPDCNSSSLK